MGKFRTQLLWVLMFSIIVAATPTGALAQSSLNYRGCLKAKGKLRKLIRGHAPVSRCKQSEVEIGLAAADVVDALIDSSATVIDLANGLDDRLLAVEEIAAEIPVTIADLTAKSDEALAKVLDKVEGKIFMDDFNTAFGRNTLTEGLIDNTAVGAGTLRNLDSTGLGNTAIGKDAMTNTIGVTMGTTSLGSFNTAVGRGALRDAQGRNNIAIGNNAGSLLGDGDENIYIGNAGDSESDTIRIGEFQETTFIAGISDASVTGAPVVVTSSGQLGVEMSSRRYKKDIEPLGELSQDLMRLKPVAYRYKESNANGQQPLQYGLIAEEVAQVYPELVAYSKDGRVQTVKYHKLSSMLLNELQKQHKQVQRQEDIIAKLVTRLARVEAKLAN